MRTINRPVYVHVVWQRVVPLTSHWHCTSCAGGALATLAALDLSLNLQVMMQQLQGKCSTASGSLLAAPLPRLLVLSFGSPRVGNRAFAEWVDQRVPSMFRVEVDGDLICRMPHVTYTCGKGLVVHLEKTKHTTAQHSNT